MTDEPKEDLIDVLYGESSVRKLMDAISFDMHRRKYMVECAILMGVDEKVALARYGFPTERDNPPTKRR